MCASTHAYRAMGTCFQCNRLHAYIYHTPTVPLHIFVCVLTVPVHSFFVCVLTVPLPLVFVQCLCCHSICAATCVCAYRASATCVCAVCMRDAISSAASIS